MANIEFSNYDVHKQLYAALAEPSKEEILTKLTSIGAWFSTTPSCNYYTLMCREIYDFTTFHFNNMNYTKGMRKVEQVLKSRGKILDINYDAKNDAYECWVQSKSDNEIRMYYLFKSDFMIVEIDD